MNIRSLMFTAVAAAALTLSAPGIALASATGSSATPAKALAAGSSANHSTAAKNPRAEKVVVKKATLRVREPRTALRVYSRCGTDSTGGNIKTCVSVGARGSFIQYAYSYAEVIKSKSKIESCLTFQGKTGPAKTIGCTPPAETPPGYYDEFRWEPYNYEPAGQYCANTWKYDQVILRVGHECVSVP